MLFYFVLFTEESIFHPLGNVVFFTILSFTFCLSALLHTAGSMVAVLLGSGWRILLFGATGSAAVKISLKGTENEKQSKTPPHYPFLELTIFLFCHIFLPHQCENDKAKTFGTSRSQWQNAAEPSCNMER